MTIKHERETIRENIIPSKIDISIGALRNITWRTTEITIDITKVISGIEKVSPIYAL